MSKRIIESMRNFHYFVKLRNTHKELPSKFFSRFFLSKIPKKPETKKSMNNFVFKFSDYKSGGYIEEKPIRNELLLSEGKDLVVRVPDKNCLLVYAQQLSIFAYSVAHLLFNSI